MALSRGPKIITDGLILCLDAADKKSYSGSGTTWYDRSGNNDNATLIDGAAFSADGGGCIACDGADDYVELQPTAQDNGSIEIWIKTSFDGTYSYAFGQNNNSDSAVNAMAIHSPTDSYSGNYWVRNAAGSEQASVLTTNPLNDGVWHQVVCMWGSEGLKIYVDGILNDTDSSTVNGTSANQTHLRLGGLTTTNYFCPISFAIARIYSIQLTDEEVIQNFNAMRGRFGL